MQLVKAVREAALRALSAAVLIVECAQPSWPEVRAAEAVAVRGRRLAAWGRLAFCRRLADNAHRPAVPGPLLVLELGVAAAVELGTLGARPALELDALRARPALKGLDGLGDRRSVVVLVLLGVIVLLLLVLLLLGVALVLLRLARHAVVLRLPRAAAWERLTRGRLAIVVAIPHPELARALRLVDGIPIVVPVALAEATVADHTAVAALIGRVVLRLPTANGDAIAVVVRVVLPDTHCVAVVVGVVVGVVVRVVIRGTPRPRPLPGGGGPGPLVLLLVLLVGAAAASALALPGVVLVGVVVLAGAAASLRLPLGLLPLLIPPALAVPPLRRLLGPLAPFPPRPRLPPLVDVFVFLPLVPLLSGLGLLAALGPPRGRGRCRRRGGAVVRGVHRGLQRGVDGGRAFGGLQADLVPSRRRLPLRRSLLRRGLRRPCLVSLPLLLGPHGFLGPRGFLCLLVLLLLKFLCLLLRVPCFRVRDVLFTRSPPARSPEGGDIDDATIDLGVAHALDGLDRAIGALKLAGAHA
mmetsp:Transcript_143118/g.457342  ORF Transcript_143118/g.457342 Transcript_143118/m.457342 type:complete len:525 (+) Transcript_143118:261-1835(+)